jgi:hypothetical protein
MALKMAPTVYIAHAPEPRVVLRNFVEDLEKKVVKACRGWGDAAKAARRSECRCERRSGRSSRSADEKRPLG